MRSRGLVAVAAVGVLFAAAACGGGGSTGGGNAGGGKTGGGNGGAGGPITLSFVNWASAEQATAGNMKKAIAAFEKQNPTIHIKNVPVPFDNMEQQLTIKLSGGNPPDVMQLNGNWAPEFGARGYMMDMRKVAPQSYLADEFKGAVATCSFNGTLYAVPWTLTPHAFWYNKDLMRKAGLDPSRPPTTIQQLNHDMAVIKAKLGGKGVYPIGIDTTQISYSLNEFFPYYFAFGGYPLAGHQPHFNSTGVKAALGWAQMVAKKGYTPMGQQIKVERQLMAKDKIVFKGDGPYLVGILRTLDPSLNGKAFYKHFGVEPFPVGPGGQHPGQTLGDIHELGIAAHTAHPKAAWKFVHYLTTSPYVIKEFLLPQGGYPPLKSQVHALEKKGVLDDPVSKAYIHQILPRQRTGPWGPKYGHAANVLIRAFQQVVVAKQPVNQVAAQTQGSLKSIYGS